MSLLIGVRVCDWETIQRHAVGFHTLNTVEDIFAKAGDLEGVISKIDHSRLNVGIVYLHKREDSERQNGISTCGTSLHHCCTYSYCIGSWCGH